MTSSSSTNTNEPTETWVKLTVIDLQGNKKPGYTVMMFSNPVTSGNALPTILIQVTTDANGLAYFDLNTFITSPVAQTYYFEAFIKSGQNYLWESISHPSHSLKKGTRVTGSIIVN